MIEVERSFDLRPGDRQRLLEGARFVNKKLITDVYYDTPGRDLTTRDLWLRARNGKFELKVPLNTAAAGGRATDQYRELESDAEIAAALGADPSVKIEDALGKKNIRPFATIVTHRERYTKGRFNLDFDEMDFGFSTFEAERMVETPAEMPDAERDILEFAKQHGLALAPARGKVIEYIARNDPGHFSLLVRSGVVKN